jgi:hypothetical protein
MPKRGVTYQPDKIGCPDGYVDNGAEMCSTSYAPITYGKKIVTADCTGNRDRVGLACYEHCPIIDGKNGEKIQLKNVGGLCLPYKGQTYSVLSYVPETYAKPRKVPYSQK